MRDRTSFDTMVIFGLLLLVALASANEVATVGSHYLDVYAVNQYGYSAYPSSVYQHNTFGDIYQSPVIILAPSGEGLVAYYADNGLRSVIDYKSFKPLFDVLYSSGQVSGLVLSYQAFTGNQFLHSAVHDFVLPDNFRVSDFLRNTEFKSVPVVYLAPKEVFNAQHFVGLNHVYRFSISETNVDPVPVHGSSFPYFNQFYASPYQNSNNYQSNNQPNSNFPTNNYGPSYYGNNYYPYSFFSKFQTNPNQYPLPPLYY